MHNQHFKVPQCVLDESRSFLRHRGAQGFEGTALWAGYAGDGISPVQIERLIVPEQVATTTELGAAVDLTERAHLTLPDLLHHGERFFARIHSHPGRAYHSEKDDANEVISHQGAISIVVPYFARDPIALERCAIYRLEHGRGWLPLTSDDIGVLFQVTA